MAEKTLRDYSTFDIDPAPPKGVALPKRHDPKDMDIRLTIIVLNRKTGETTVFGPQNPQDDIPDGIQINSGSQAESDDQILKWRRLLEGKQTKTYVFTHGFGGSVKFDDDDNKRVYKGWIPKAIEQIKVQERESFLLDGHEFVNFLAFDWRKGANGMKGCVDSSHSSDGKILKIYKLIFYDQATSNTRTVGVVIADFLHHFAAIMPPNDVHLIGFSLGAHAMGFAGKQYQFLAAGQKLGRITGLDPAGPIFNTLSQCALDKSDAKFVDVIHTNAGIFGIKRALGHADFWVGKSPEDTWLYHNEHQWGSAQPACFDNKHTKTSAVAFKIVKKLDNRYYRQPTPPPPQDDNDGTAGVEGTMGERLGMSHYRAHIYFRHSIREPALFRGIDETTKEESVMGFRCSPTVQGNFNVPLDEKNEKLKQYYKAPVKKQEYSEVD